MIRRFDKSVWHREVGDSKSARIFFCAVFVLFAVLIAVNFAAAITRSAPPLDLTEKLRSIYGARSMLSAGIALFIGGASLVAIFGKQLPAIYSKRLVVPYTAFVGQLALNEVSRLSLVRDYANTATSVASMVGFLVLTSWFIFLCLTQPIRREVVF